MSLIGALNIGQSALAVTQTAIQTTGNNISNAGNADYTRQVTGISPSKDQQIQPGVFVGTGVKLDSIQRQIDEALESRIRSSISDDESAASDVQWMGRVESIFNELSDQDLSTQMSTFFNSWSDLANKPQDIGLRQVVIQNGASLAQSTQDLRGQLTSLQTDVDDRIEALVNNADSLAEQIANLNGQISQAEGGAGGTANGLRDQRDSLLKQLSTLIDIKTVPQDNGVINVYAGTEPLILNADNRGIGSRTENVNGTLKTVPIIKSNNAEINVSSGQLGSLSDVRKVIDNVIEKVDTVAHNLIFELNKLHASGQGLQGFSTATSSNLVDDATAALSSSAAGMKFTAQSGSFVVHVTNKLSGLTTSTLVQVDVDGANGNDTTLQSLAASINGIANISASVSGGRLSMQSDSSDVEFSFSQDSSGILSALGVNSFFTGSDAHNIALNTTISDSPSLLAAARNGEKGDNQTALSIAGLESISLNALGGASLKQSYEAMVNGVATGAQASKTNAEATTAIRETLQSQREALSGVSLDEEAVNLIKQQRAFQGAARFIATVNEMMSVLLQIV